MTPQDSHSRDGLARYLQLQTMRGLSLRPRILLVSCSDFWVDPHVLAGTSPGEMLQIKTPGNIVPPLGTHPTSEAATIEMAITEFQVSDIIVLGHSSCRCMTNLMSPDSLGSVPCVGDWFRYADATRQIVQNKYSDRTAYSQIEAAVEENVLVQLNHLKTHPSVSTAMALDRVALHGWLFRAETGDVATYVSKLGRFVSLSTEGGNPARSAADSVVARARAQAR